MKTPLVIHWFRQDLRLSDNPALYNAAQSANILPIYILDDVNASENFMGSASQFWLHHSLLSLKDSLQGNLSVYRGDPLSILVHLCGHYNIDTIYWNRCYEPWSIRRDTTIRKELEKHGITVISFNGSLLWEPWEIKKDDGSHYKVFTPFYRRACLSAPPPREPLPVPETLNTFKDETNVLTISDLSLLPKIGWDKKMKAYWEMGEKATHQRFATFLKTGIAHYKGGRDFPSQSYVSRLSPSLHFGEISPNTIWYKLQRLDTTEYIQEHIEHFCSELGWREFSYSQLYFYPDLPKKNLQQKFDAFRWKNNEQNFLAWTRGETGIPIIDAGMKELWQTGYMHNRVRMLVGSFLVKNLLIDWRWGERWFWDCLVDADLASNSASWQWVAGCGADAAPYFRIFNPVTQGQKFDSEGIYIRKYLPVLEKLPNKYLFSPWEAPQAILKTAGITLGIDYPRPIVDLKLSREEALQLFSLLKYDSNHSVR